MEYHSIARADINATFHNNTVAILCAPPHVNVQLYTPNLYVIHREFLFTKLARGWPLGTLR